jgi:hypothetical protein
MNPTRGSFIELGVESIVLLASTLGLG